MQSLSQFTGRRATTRRIKPGRPIRRGLAAALAAAALSLPAVAKDQLEGLAVEPLAVVTADGERRELLVYLARTREQKRTGLMFVEALAPERGMLFVYDPPRHVAMWMKNTLIPLDMLFVRSDGTVESIAAHTEPLSERQISSEGEVSAVLELNAGTAVQLGIRPGDRLLHSWFTDRD